MTASGPPRNPLETPAWPDPAGAGADAPLEQYKSRLAEAADRRSEFSAASHESHVAIEAAQIEVLKGSLERARDSAKTIQTAASGIATLYTGVAALVFSVTDKNPLPVRGVIPVLFLGAAIVFATIFLAWVSPGSPVRPFPEAVDATSIRVERVKWFGDWISLRVLQKAWALRLAALYLAAGLVFLPAPFIPVHKLATATSRKPGANSAFFVDEVWIWIAFGAVFLLATVVVWYQARYGRLHDAIEELTFKPAGVV